MQFMKMIPGLIQNWSAQCRWLSLNRAVLSSRGLRLALFLCLPWAACVFLAGCQSPYDAYDAGMTASDAYFRAGTADYSTNRLQEGDVVSIMFRYSTNFDTVQKIGLDGTLNLDVAGQIKAVNKTVLQLQGELTALYQSQAKDDPITVKIVAPEAAVYVDGEVSRPGKIPMDRPMTVVEAIMEAGGFDPLQANLSDVSVLRVENGRERTYRLNLKRVFDGKDDTVFYLKPFDVVRIPAKTFNY
jgi:polysaccharide biosynthesis/export protein